MDFRILGPIEVREDGRSLTLGGLRQRALLAALLLHAGESVSRDVLIDELWAGRAPSGAVNSLHVQVSRLRRALGGPTGPLESTAVGYRLRIGPQGLDLWRFERLCGEGRRAMVAGELEAAVGSFHAALGEWHGAPLADVAYEAFAQAEIARLEELRAAAVEDRIEAELALGRGPELVGELEALVRRDPLRERLRAQLMLALYRGGRQGDALEAYRQAARALDAELGVRPGPELQRVQHAILAHDPSLAPAAPRTEVSEQPSRAVSLPLPAALAVDDEAPFVGRAAELAELRAAWDAAKQGRRQGVLVTGEPGIGKTRLATEAARRVADDDGLVLYGHCDDGLAAPAQAFAEALGPYVAVCPLDRLSSATLPVLPRLSDRLATPPEPEPADPDGARLQTFDAIASLLAGAARDRPVLLVLDDLHWADDLSLHLLRHVLRAGDATRMLVLATYRDTEPRGSGVLEEVVTGLGRRADVRRLELGPLEEPDVAAILENGGGDARLAAGIRETTEGNPFFVGEVVRALGDDPVTPRVRDVVRWRLARLPDGTADVLTVCAVAGGAFDADVTATASGVGLSQTLDALEAAEGARLVRPLERSDRFAFVHTLVRDAILTDLSGARRARLHAQVADALERASATRAVDSGELAVHFLAAGSLADAAKAVRYARKAGDQAARRLAFDVAAEHYGCAQEALTRLPSAAVEDRLDLELARGRALRLAGDERADGVLRRAAMEAEQAGNGRRMGEALLAIGLELATRFLEEDAEMLALLRRAVALLPAGDSAVKARLLGFIANEALYSLTDGERQALIDDALAMARRAGDAVALASVLTSSSWALMSPDHLPARIAFAEELIVVGDRGGPYAECFGHVFRHLAAIELGDLAAADASLTAARAASRVPVARWTVNQWSALRLLLAGRLVDAEAEAVRGAEAAREAAMPTVVVDGSFAAVMWCIRAVQGRLAELGSTVRAWAGSLGEQPVWSDVTEAQLLRELDDLNGARAAFERAVRKGLLELPRGFAWMSTMTWAADLCAWLGDRPRAARLQELLSPFAGVILGESGPVDRALGRLAIALEDRPGAERHLRNAVVLCERMDARAYLAVARLDLGELLLPSEEGHRLVVQARTAAEEMGMPGTARARAPS